MEPTIIGTLSITLGSISINPAGPPHTYLSTARNFLSGALTLGAVPSCALPLTFLAAQATECGLKAYLSRSGDDGRLKRHPIRHDLVVLWSLAASEGLAVSSTPPQWVANLSQLHGSPYYLRYSTGVHGLVLPAAEPMVTELTKLIETISLQLN